MTVILGIIASVVALAAALIIMTGGMPMFLAAPFVLLANAGATETLPLLVFLAVVIGGVVATFYAQDTHSPGPQAIAAGAIAVVLMLVELCSGRYDLLEGATVFFLGPVLFFTVLFPMVTLVAALVALPLRLLTIRTHAFLNLFTMVGVAAVLDALAELIGLQAFVCMDVFDMFEYMFPLRAMAKPVEQVLALYYAVPVGLRLLVSAVLACLFGYAQYVREEEIDLAERRRRRRRRRERNRYQPSAPRNTAPARTAAPLRPAAQVETSMSPADAAMLDALALQIESGTPVGINTRTGTAAVQARR